MKNKDQTAEDKSQAKLDQILTVLQDLFILQAAKAGLPSDAIRSILRIDKKRIGTISKHIKSE